MRWTKLFLTVLVAALAFGGSFECRSGDDHDDDDGRRAIRVRVSTAASHAFTAAIA
jgi:hypothetical protein